MSWYRSPWRAGPTPHGTRRSRQEGLVKNGNQGKWKIAAGREQIIFFMTRLHGCGSFIYVEDIFIMDVLTKFNVILVALLREDKLTA